MSADQLIAKALSTTSEEEAIACLVMARKKGLKLVSSSDGKHTVESRTKQLQNLLDMYNTLKRDHQKLINKFNEHEHENVINASKLKKQISWTRKTAVIAVILSIMLTATVANSISNRKIKALQAEMSQMELAPCQTIFCVIGRRL
jgi:hypothetical protein